MDNAKTGAFIAGLRGELGLTQKELADRIGVTDKAVSKWERGRGFPDVAILEILAKELNVSVTELISGERATPETVKAQSDSTLVETLLYVKRMTRKIAGTLLVIFGACLLSSPIFMAGISTPLFVMGIIVTAGGVFMLASKKSFGSINLPKLVLESVSLGALAAALVLEALPNGVVMQWAVPPGESPKYTMYSYFALTPFGYGNFPPLITAVMTVVVTIFTVIVMLSGKRFVKPRNALFVCIIVTAVISACTFLYGFRYVTTIGVLITLLLMISAIFRAAANAGH